MKNKYKKKYLLQISLMFVAIVAIGCPSSPPAPECINTSSVSISYSTSMERDNFTTGLFYKLSNDTTWMLAGSFGDTVSISRTETLSCKQSYDFLYSASISSRKVCTVQNGIFINEPNKRIIFNDDSPVSPCPLNLPSATRPLPTTGGRPLPTTGGRTCNQTTCRVVSSGAIFTGYVAPGERKCYDTEAECRNNRYCFNSAGNGCTAGYYRCPDTTTSTMCRSTLAGCRALSACSSE